MSIILHTSGETDCICYEVFEYGDIEGLGTHFGAKLLAYFDNDETLAWQMVRTIRRALLDECEWTQSNDSVLTLTERETWRIYRQKLRDIPQDFPIISDVQFPVIP